MRRSLFPWSVLLAVSVGCAGAGTAGDVEVRALGLRSAAGDLLVALCDAGSFLRKGCPRTGRAAASAGRVLVRDVPPGVYAVQAFHDENRNNSIDRDLLGRPLEGIGFSRDARMRFGPPAFRDAAVEIPPAGGSLSLTMRYLQ